MKTGTVKFFNEAKGYGFITETAAGKDYFVHANQLKGLKLYKDNKVNFDIRETEKGPEAVAVSIIAE